jgi:hypothetical protein
MGVDREDGSEGFLRRWSRVKTEAREAPTPPPAPVPTAAPESQAADAAPPELPPIENLTLESDFSGFFHPKVDEDLRRRALRKLFSDPHFNVMDGLDVYIDDYSKTEPIPAAMLASLKQAQRIFEWAAEKNESKADEKSVQTQTAAEAELASPPAALDELNGEGIAPPAVAAAEPPAPIEGAAIESRGTR